ncbi:C-type mannose receptor 2-like [Cyprinodon tularosa]|uniref:C-type mannose receptor 2-like n=1 Tax=Cyprinodon tularosa TaxID=77115 RepID=UPI0018E26F8A|nr:C-type mannose receptor 2-like [Cyprinodon tularosa]
MLCADSFPRKALWDLLPQWPTVTIGCSYPTAVTNNKDGAGTVQWCLPTTVITIQTVIVVQTAGQSFLAVCKLYVYHYIDKKWKQKRLAWSDLPNRCKKNLSLPGVKLNESDLNWNKGEPNDVDTENCGFLLKDLTLGDVSCRGDEEYKSYFVCFDDHNQRKRFHLIKIKSTWLEAQSYCRQKHTDLVSGINQLQDPQLKEEINSIDTFVFVGLFRDTWQWSDGSSFSFRHWHKEFDDEGEMADHCVAIDDKDGWNINRCTKQMPFICYEDKVILIKKKMNWEDALYYCRDHYHDLVTITSLDEQRWIQEKAKKASTDYVWMGLHYTCTLDFWFWVSDEVVRYKNWASGEPVDDCDMSGAMETGGEHKWRKMNDEKKFNFICAKF